MKISLYLFTFSLITEISVVVGVSVTSIIVDLDCTVLAKIEVVVVEVVVVEGMLVTFSSIYGGIVESSPLVCQ